MSKKIPPRTPFSRTSAKISYKKWQKSYLDPNFTKPTAIREVGEQIYTFPLFKPVFCEKIISEMEGHGSFMNEIDIFEFPPIHPQYPFNPPQKIPNTLKVAGAYLQKYFGVPDEDPDYHTQVAFPTNYL